MGPRGFSWWIGMLALVEKTWRTRKWHVHNSSGVGEVRWSRADDGSRIGFNDDLVGVHP